MGIKSLNLSKRNELIYKKFFNTTGRKGRFSKYINDKLNQDFTLNGIEAIKQEIRENSKKIDDLEALNEALVKKLRILIDKHETKNGK